MAQRVVGGGERWVATRIVGLSGVTTASIQVPQGCDLARIQPQLLTNSNDCILIGRGGTKASPTLPTVALNELQLFSGDVDADCFPAGEIISFRIVTPAGVDVVGGASDRISVAFYTNIAGRAQKVVG